MTNTKTWSTLRLAGATIALIALLLYGYNQAHDLIRGPVIEITSPAHNELVEDDMVTITGRTENIARITLNGSPIFISPEGEFEERLPLSGRYTIMRVAVEDRFGRTQSVERGIVRGSTQTPPPSRTDIKEDLFDPTDTPDDREADSESDLPGPAEDSPDSETEGEISET